MEDGTAEAPPVDQTADRHITIDDTAPVTDTEELYSDEESDALAGPSTTESDDEEFLEEEGGAEQSEEDRARMLQRKKKKRRELKRKANETLRKYYQQPKPEKEETEEEEETERISSEGEEEGWKVLDVDGEEEEENKSPVLSSSDEDEDDRQRVLTSFKGDFFDNFYFPSYSDITTEEEELTAEQESAQPTEEKEVVESGPEQPAAAAATSEKDTDLIREVQEDAAEEMEDEASSSSTISFDWPFPLDDEVAPMPKAAETAFDMDMLIEIAAVADLQQASTIDALPVDQVNRQICVEVLYKIIDDLVKSAEYVDPLKVLQAKLDKKLLIKKLHILIQDCMVAESFNSSVSHKMHDYYRRVGQLRCFDALPLHLAGVEFRRYKDAMKLLDHLKNKADITKKAHRSLISEVMCTLDVERAVSLSTEESLEHCIRSSLLRKDFLVLPRIVDSELRRMQIIRNEISDSRLFLITRQHTLGMVLERKCKLNQISADLTMDQFLSAQRDVIALGTKVEERNCDLNRMRDRCTKQVHLLAFIREKTSMLSASLISLKTSLNDKMGRLSMLRDKMLVLKLQHSNLKIRKAALVAKNGLLYKPALLYDYDKTVELIEMKKERVKKMRNTIQDMESRLELLLSHRRSWSFSVGITTK